MLDGRNFRALRVLVVIGTRPEAIKMIPVIRALQQSRRYRPVVISTGQHADMVADLLHEFDMRIDANLHAADRVGGEAPSLNTMFARIITGIDRVWSEPEIPKAFQADGKRQVDGAIACLVHGDTSSAAAAAIASFNLQIPVVHVEAGLRTSNLLSPFPEEGNRQLISRIAALHLAPTQANKANLVAEGVDPECIVVTGNTSIDMLRLAAAANGGYGPGLEMLERDPDAPFVLVTAHRRENWGAGLAGIAEAVRQLAGRYPELRFVVPMHPNPTARQPLRAALDGLPNAMLIEPRAYPDFARLMGAARLIITDSGGVQEEAPALGTPVLVARDTTERQEGIDAGTLVLVGTDPRRIVEEAVLLLDDEREHARRAGTRNPYGDGYAADRIVQAFDLVAGFTSVADATIPAGLRESVLRHVGRSDLAVGSAHD